MAELVTATQMRAIEARAIASGRVTGLELMERAGRGVVAAILEDRPALAATSHSAVVLCGPGNNGGDGFVVARLLQARGWAVGVYLYGDIKKLPPDARVNHDRWVAMGQVAPLFPDDIARGRGKAVERTGQRLEPGQALIVDALFGTGLRRALDPRLADLFAALTEIRSADGGAAPLVSVDMPSGICADSGRVLVGAGRAPAAFPADLTVTFHAAKIGHFLAAGPGCCTKLSVKDIGLQPWHGSGAAGSPDRAPGGVVANPETGIGRLGKSTHHHKYSHGHALVLSGPMGRSGAARLAARAALRVGAGLVTVAAPGSAMMECATQLTAIMLRKCNDARTLAKVLEDKRLTALCLGPGLGVGEGTRALVGTALADRDRAVVLDADALTAFADRSDALFALLHARAVLTPHGGEFARLFPDIAAELNAPAARGPAFSKVDATRAAAARAGCTVLFKGADTVIAEPGGRCTISASVYDRAAPWLATAGSGDVLAGLITGLLARGVPPMRAAQTGADLHGAAARAFGPGLVAEDLPEMLPQVFRDNGL